MPLPWETASERALGRTTITTGIPIKSRPVTLAMRVIPMRGMSSRTRATVSAGSTVLWVPALKRLGPRSPAAGQIAGPVMPIGSASHLDYDAQHHGAPLGVLVKILLQHVAR